MEKIITAAGREVEIDRKALRKMRTIAALSSGSVDRILGAVGQVCVSISADELGDMNDTEFADLVERLGQEYRLPKAS